MTTWTWARFWSYISTTSKEAQRKTAHRLDLDKFLTNLGPEEQVEVLEYAPKPVKETFMRSGMKVVGKDAKGRKHIGWVKLHPEAVKRLMRL